MRSLLLLAAVLLAALTWAITPASTQAARSGAAKPLVAVKALLQPQSQAGSRSPGCYTSDGIPANCPITTRFLRAFSVSATNVNPICHCATAVSRPHYRLNSNNGRSAFVDAAMRFGGGPRYTLTFVVVHQLAGWYVDDVYCAGRRATSIYRNPVECF